MPPNLPLDHWPPPLPHEEGSQFAWEKMHEMTCAILINTNRASKSLLGKSKPSGLILELSETNVPTQPLSLLHGLDHPTHPTKKPLWIRPSELTFETLKRISDSDREQIARVLCYDYAADEWQTRQLLKGMDNPEELDDDEKEENKDEPWTVKYDWEDLADEDADETEDLLELFSCPDFQAHMKQMLELRRLYQALLKGTLEEANLYPLF